MQAGSVFATRAALPSDPYEVGRETIRQFATALGHHDPVHHDPAAARALGHPDLIAPPTFAVLLTLRSDVQAAVEVFGDRTGDGPDLDGRAMLHRDQSFTHLRPIHAGDRLVARTELTPTELDGRLVARVTTAVDTADGEPVCVATSTLLVTGADR